MPPLLYIALCLMVPLLWGIAAARVFDAWQARQRAQPGAPSDEDAPDMYHI